jgi:hypothetical protein
MSAWPSSICTARRSAPWFSRCVAKAWRSVCGDSGEWMPPARVFFDQHPEHHAAHALAVAGDEQVVGLLPAQDGRPRLGEVAHDPLPRHLAERHQALLAALAHDAQHALVEAEVKGLEPTSSLTRRPLAYSSSSMARSRRPSGVSLVGRGQQRLDLGFAQRLGNAQRLFGRLQLERRVRLYQALAQRPAEVALEHREPAVGRGRLGRGMPGGKVAVEVGLGRGVQRARPCSLAPSQPANSDRSRR